jgi:predicted regulator of Ras-like GTPase activity (Roadblock/LC7/MglB family)
MDVDALLAEMRVLRDRVVGITDTALASRDGLIITADTETIDPDNLAALAASTLGIAQRMAAEAGQGMLRESLTSSSGGHVATYAVGGQALLVVVCDAGVDLTRLFRESRLTIENLRHLLTRTGPRIGGEAITAG